MVHSKTWSYNFDNYTFRPLEFTTHQYLRYLLSDSELGKFYRTGDGICIRLSTSYTTHAILELYYIIK